MKYRKVLALLGICTGLASTTAGLATTDTYNVEADWSNTDNPNGPWSYLRGTTLLPNQPTSCCGLPPIPSFAPSHVPGTFLPWFGHNPSLPEIGVHSYDPVNGGAFVGEAVLAWTAPYTGVADVSGYFYYSQGNSTLSNDLTIRLGGAFLGSAVLSFSEHQDSAHPWEFSFDNLSMNAGEMLTVTFHRSADFSAGSGTGGNMIVMLTAVPEPEIYAMMLVGLGLVGFTARKQKQKTT